jgi:general secretion pathway protein F
MRAACVAPAVWVGSASPDPGETVTATRTPGASIPLASLPNLRALMDQLSTAWQRGARTKELIMFAEDLAILLGSGVPLTRGLIIVSELTERQKFRQIIIDVYQRVKEGSSLWQALQAYPAYFPPILINLVKAGESGGVLEESLSNVANYLVGIQELKEYLVSALTYPVILLFTAGLSILVLLTFVIPKFALIFSDMGVALPLATRMMLAAGSFLRASWWILLLLLAALAAGWRYYYRTPKGRLNWDRMKLRLPIFGTMHRKTEISRFSRTLGTLLGSGVPILESLLIVRGVVVNRVIYDYLQQLYGDLKQGVSMSRSLASSNLFPSMAVHLIGVGEETGRLGEMLKKIADIYERDLKVSIKNFTALFEPLVILVMGLVIGAMVVSMLMAIFSINDMGL